MDICIVGVGLCGKALFRFCQARGDRVCVYDDTKKGSFICNSLESVDSFDYVIVSPGIHPHHRIYQLAKKKR